MIRFSKYTNLKSDQTGVYQATCQLCGYTLATSTIIKHPVADIVISTESDIEYQYSHHNCLPWDERTKACESIDRQREIVRIWSHHYALESWVERGGWEAGDEFDSVVNQAERPHVILAIIGGQGIAEYEMPKGTTALVYVKRYDHDSPSTGKTQPYSTIPLKWLKAIADTKIGWVGNPQSCSWEDPNTGKYTTFPQPDQYLAYRLAKTGSKKTKSQPSDQISTPIPIDPVTPSETAENPEKCRVCGVVSTPHNQNLCISHGYCRNCCLQGSHNDLTVVPDLVRWSGKQPVPTIGTRVQTFGETRRRGTVESYFVEYGWLGIKVRHDVPFKFNDEMREHGHYFGCDLDSLTPEQLAPMPVMQGNFGLPMAGVTTYWGARAIYKPRSSYPIDILPDRQSCLGEMDTRKELVEWLNAVGMPWLKANCKLYSDSREYVEHRDGKFIIKATPNASYGYLYIGSGIVSS